MIFAGLVASAVAVFLGIFTKLPQGGGGLVNNLMVMSCFFSGPPLLPPPPPPPRAIFFDRDAAIWETHDYFLLHPTTTGNVTHGPMPRPDAKPCPTAGNSSHFPPPSPPFTFPAFLHLLPLSKLCLALGETIGNIAMVLLTLCLPWLTLQLHLRGTTLAATPVAINTGAGGQLTQIQPHSQLLADLQTIISERDEALAELKRVVKQAKEGDRRALERDLEREEALQGMQKQRDEALEKLARGIEDWEKMGKEKEKEEGEGAEGLKKEMTRQIKAWGEKDKEWEEERAREKKTSREDKEGLVLGRERERESWKGEVERLEEKKAEDEENMRGKMKEEREGWAKEREVWEKKEEAWWKEKEEEIEGRDRVEAERKSLVEENDRAQRRIDELEGGVRRLNEERSSSSGGGEWQGQGQRTPRGGNESRRGAETPRGAGGSPWRKPHWRPPGR